MLNGTRRRSARTVVVAACVLGAASTAAVMPADSATKKPASRRSAKGSPLSTRGTTTTSASTTNAATSATTTNATTTSATTTNATAPIGVPFPSFPTLASCPAPEDAVGRWPLRARVAQLVAFGVDGRSLADARRLVGVQHVGGLIVRSAPVSAAQLTTDIANIHRLDGAIPTTFAVDEEGGRVQVLRAALGALPSARKLSADTPEKLRRAVRDHHTKVRAIGFDMILGPVLDVTSDTSGVIGDRSFGGDPMTVGRLGSAYAAGVRDAQMIPVIKHFPGHGSVTGDSHVGRVSTSPIERLRERDEVPFRMSMADGPTAVMVGHLEVPGLTGDIPSTLSLATITFELRTVLGFDGLVMTDSLSMGAVTSRWRAPAAAVEAIAAGADVALFVTISERDAVGVIDALEHAVSVGRITEPQLNRSVVRVVRSKNLDPCAVDPGVLERQSMAAEAAYQATR